MKKKILALYFLSLSLVLLLGAFEASSKGSLADGDITSVTVSDVAAEITITVNGAYSTNYLMYINTDDNEDTGFYIGDWSGGGADYLVQAGALYRYTGVAGAWGWTYAGASTVVDGASRVFTIKRQHISVPSLRLGDVIDVGYTDDGDAFPDTAGLQAYTLTTDPEIIGITTSVDATNLYVTITGATFDAAWHLYLDADGNSATGFAAWPFPTSSGAEYLIEQGGGGNLFTGTDGTGEWSWTWVGGATISTTATETVVTVPLASFTISTDFSVAYFGTLTNQFVPGDGSFKPQSLDDLVWDGSAWSDGAPTATDHAVIDGNYNGGTLTTANLVVNHGATLTISSGETLTIDGDLVNEGAILIESGGSLITYDANSISGNAVTFQRNTRYADAKYSFVGTPIMQYPTVVGSDLGSNVYRYNEVTAYDADEGLARWEDASVDQLLPGVGYTQASQQALSFSGTPNTGTITVAGLSHTEDAGSALTARGWNMVSNPYTAAVDVTAFIADNTNIEGSIYLWDDHGSAGGRGDNGDYLSANAIGVVAGPNGGSFNGYIGSAQGFFVQVSSAIASTSVVFNESQRVVGSNLDANFFRKASITDQASVKVSLNGDYYNETLIGFREDATLGHDRLYDAKKRVGNDNIAFYSMLEGEKYAIQGLPALTADQSIELAYDLAESGTYSLDLVEAINLPDGFDVILMDTNNGVEYNLSLDGAASLSLIAGQKVTGYELQLRNSAVLALAEELSHELNVYFSNDVLNLEMVDADIQEANISIYNLLGSNVASFNNQQMKDSKWSSSIYLEENRVYILTVTSRTGIVSTKFIK